MVFQAKLGFCGGNLQTTEKPSVFPMSCCNTQWNGPEPEYRLLMGKLLWYKDIRLN